MVTVATFDPRVAVVQSRPGADTASNLRDIRQAASAARDDGAHIVVFPEYSHFIQPRMDRAWVDAAEPLDGRFASALAELASELGVFLVAGMLEEVSDGERFSNTLIAVDPDGERAATYRKLHLYD